MFSTKGLFQDVTCPNIDACLLLNCIFSHNNPENVTTTQVAAAFPAKQTLVNPQANKSGLDSPISNEHGVKRRRIENGVKDPSSSPVVSPALDRQPTKTFVGTLASNRQRDEPKNLVKQVSSPSTAQKPLKSALKPISPPPISARKPDVKGAKLAAPTTTTITTTQPPKAEVKEQLNPRLLKKNPAPHASRRQCLVKMHECMMRLNNEAAKSTDAETKSIVMTSNELIRAALDEEEKIALDQPLVYANIIKHRIVAYKKMKLDEWKKSRLELKASKEIDPSKPKAPPPLETGLKPEEEITMISTLVIDQDGLDKHGYVTSPPTEDQVQEAEKAVQMAAGWEVCDRCASRFQVFPNRREDGALTSGGVCTYHWGRAYQPKWEKTDAIQGVKEKQYSCCNRIIGSPGCVESQTHVFKISDPRRLASVLAFKETPVNDKVQSKKAVCFDCEMGYTCYGLELIRLTATSWPEGSPLLDILVRPIGAILDLNSRFSGVHPEQYFNAPEYTSKSVINDPKNLHIVCSPAVARDLLLSHLNRDTPLLGHALENDLNAVRLIHPTIVDTVFLYPHPRGLPYRFGLRNLAKQFLDKDIQTAGAAGHDSLEDARATGDLVRARIRKEWTKLKNSGWTVKNGAFYPPSSSVPSALPLPDNPIRAIGRDDQAAERKRKRPEQIIGIDTITTTTTTN